MIAFDVVPHVIAAVRVMTDQLNGVDPTTALVIVLAFLDFMVLADLYAPLPSATNKDQSWRWAPY